MFKYLPIVVCFPFVGVAQQANQVYYAAPYLQIEDVHKKATADGNDFGYNVLIHPDSPFIHEGFFMWVDDQWYEILNAKDVFISQNDLKPLFSISKDYKNPLKIKDINDVVYLYPIEALDSYIVSQSDFKALSRSIEKRDLITYTKPASTPAPLVVEEQVIIPSQDSQVVLLDEMQVVEIEKPEEISKPKTEGNKGNFDLNTNEPVLMADENPSSILLDVIDVVEVPKTDVSTSPKKEETAAVELPKLTTNEPVLITSENPSSVLLDVIDIVEVVKREEVPFSSSESLANKNETEEIATPIEETVPNVKISATNTLIIAKPTNAYEVAVNEGFDGTVTEWIEMIDAQGGKSAYQQAVDGGYIGSEEEWMKMLWGRAVDVEVAKKDKTTAIVSEWIQSLQTTKGNAPYEMALKHGFYGTYTEWVESVIGIDGEKAYEHAESKGFKGTYKEWIEQQLNASNQELLRKERLSKTQLFVAPNVVMPLLTEDASQPLEFDLYAYYNQYYGAPMISSDGQQTHAVEILPSDLEYQITWFEKDKIKIIGLTKEGVVSYTPVEGVTETTTRLNIRYILK